MSVHHHAEEYYSFLRKTRKRCITPGCPHRTEQFHHIALMASDKGDLLPKRHSTYQVVWVCADCHALAEASQQHWLAYFARGINDIYGAVFRALRAFGTTLEERLTRAGADIPRFHADLPAHLDDLAYRRELMRRLHHYLDDLIAKCKTAGA